MSRSSFVFTPTALRSLEHDQDLLDRHEHKRRLASCHLSSYLLRKEARERAPPRPTAGLRAAVCRDLVVQNAVYTGDLEALQRFFPRGSTANLIIEPHGGDMRWTTFGEGRRPVGCSSFFCQCACFSEALVFFAARPWSIGPPATRLFIEGNSARGTIRRTHHMSRSGKMKSECTFNNLIL